MTNNLTIYFGDLCHYNDFNAPTPLNIGYVGSYLLDRVPGIQIELFKHPVQMLEKIREDPPDIVAFSHYFWNSNLNIKVLEIAKTLNPALVSVFGGPNFNSVDKDVAVSPIVDFHIVREGEESFKILVESLIANSFAINKYIVDSLPSAVFYFDRESQKLINNPLWELDRLDLSDQSSPYLMGLMDKFLEDQNLAPIIETNRGCPFSCSFCAWGSAIFSKVRQFPLEQVVDEIRYVARRSKNVEKRIYLADANFGILKRDEEIAKVIADASVNDGFPKSTYVYFAKNTNHKVVRIAEIMKDLTRMSMSMQSTNNEVLENIRRKNIPYKQYDELRLECENRGIKTFTELIYGLPGETYQSFVNGVIEVVDRADHLAVYPLLLIEGSENNTTADREKYQIKSKFRVSARHVSTLDDLRSIEYEEVAVENQALSFDEWLRIREFHFLISLFSSDMFIDVNRELKVHGLNYAVFSLRILEDQRNSPTEWSNLLKALRQSAIDELLDAEQVKSDFDLKCLSDIELKFPALNPYYLSLLSSDAKLIKVLRKYLLDNMIRLFQVELQEDVVDGLKLALNVSFDRFICYEEFKPISRVKYPLDLNAWSNASDRESIINYRTKDEYVFELSTDSAIEKRLKDYLSSGLKLYEAIYKLRMGYIGFLGQKVFTYDRMQVMI